MNGEAKKLIKSQMILSHFSIADLHKELVDRGFDIKEGSLAARVSRGSFNADFFIELLDIMGVGIQLKPATGSTK